MNNLTVEFENCYGIRKLNATFDFNQRHTYAIYAPNGAMKTSFAKAFKDLSEGDETGDLIFPEREAKRKIQKDGIDVVADEVFVINPFDEAYSSSKISTLLANKKMKTEYDTIHLTIDREKDSLVQELKKLSGIRSGLDEKFSMDIVSDKGSFFEALVSLEQEIRDEPEPKYSDIQYSKILTDKALEFLRTRDFSEKLTEYMDKYDELIDASKYFKKGVFDHNNASTAVDILVKNGFFSANHSVILRTSDGKSEIDNEAEFAKVLEEELKRVFENPDLMKVFNELDVKLRANQELRDFRKLLTANRMIIPELLNIAGFKRKLWISYLKSNEALYLKSIQKYVDAKSSLAALAIRARSETTKWQEVISIFNRRFSVPFKLSIKNQEDVILKEELPSISFVFEDDLGSASVERDDLLQILSTGEKRALYILNIIFEVEIRKAGRRITLFIVDDVADSFDYKNKYAIIEYLMDISEESNFRQVILTHNFDFFRTVSSRFVRPKYCFMVEKSRDEVKFVGAEYFNAFEYVTESLSSDASLIASIPFVRNIVQYTRGTGDGDYLKLTSLLHVKTDTVGITKGEVESIYKRNFPKWDTLALNDKDDKIVDIVFLLADQCLAAREGANLENKIVLAMAIRLKAEIFIWSKIQNQSEIRYNQARELVARYEREFGNSEKDRIKVLKLVNLMTPENIHVNSFMYEPILDMSDEALRRLYVDVKAL